MTISKICSKCKKDKLLKYFHKDKTSLDGIYGICKECKRLYREKNKEKIKLYSKLLHEINKDEINARHRKYYDKNKGIISIRRKKQRAGNKEKIKARGVKYRTDNKEKEKLRLQKYLENNKDKVHAYQKQWREDNKDKINEKNRRRFQNDINFKITKNLRRRIQHALKDNCKSATTMELLGCTVEEFKEHLKSKFTEGMTWDRVLSGEIHIDHKIPCVFFDLSDHEQQKKCFHYSNLQPLWAVDNLRKGSRIL